ncbi:MAG: hypothetical protein EHM13_13580 [Acidobacteria bacterium]|nr:MAG: hypothetical protein EHM13_13580 [Acidobacteriota bacterium]
MPTVLGPGLTRLAGGPQTWELEGRGALGPLLARLSAFDVADLQVREVRLEDIVLPYYKGDS